MILSLVEKHVPEMCAIINRAARAYAGAIPADRYHEPYMPMDELFGEIAAGVRFSGVKQGGRLLGVMGVQDVGDVTLIRHAYVRPEAQRQGVGRALLRALVARAPRRVLVGTWAGAGWAVSFYERNGFARVDAAEKNRLLATYWSIPERQVETSVVLAYQGERPAVAPAIRALGDMEYTYWLMDRACRANFVFMAELSGGLAPEALERALVPFTRAYPLLAAKIVEDPARGAAFVPATGPVPLRRVRLDAPWDETPAGPGDPLAELFHEEQGRAFEPGEGPLARAVLADHPDGRQTLAVTFHHSAADGVSAGRAMVRLLAAAADAQEGREPKARPRPDVGPAERVAPAAWRGAEHLFRAVGHSLFQNLHRAAARPFHVPAEPKTWPDQRRDRLVRCALPEDLTGRIVAQARRERAGFHAALCAAQLTAMAARAPGRESVPMWLLHLTDLRKRVSPAVSDEALGLFFSMAENLHDVQRGRPFWDLARNVAQSLETRLAQGFPFWFLPWQARLIRLSRAARPAGRAGAVALVRQGQKTRPFVTSVSDLGRIDAPTDFGPFTLDALHLSMALGTSGLFGSAITRFAGRTFWNFTYQHPAVAPQTALAIAGDAVGVLEENV